MKGATEVVLPLLSNSDQERDEICSIAENMAGEGLQVLCVAHKVISAEEDLSERHLVERSLQFAGLIGLYDPPCLETAEAVRRCQLAGIRVHILTGDHIRTTITIARQVGILNTTAVNASRGWQLCPLKNSINYQMRILTPLTPSLQSGVAPQRKLGLSKPCIERKHFAL